MHKGQAAIGCEDVIEIRYGAADLPAVGGAYVLAIGLARRLAVTIAGRNAGTLTPGRHRYVGSARGPGGMRARVARHLCRHKSARWHNVSLLAKSENLSDLQVIPRGGHAYS